MSTLPEPAERYPVRASYGYKDNGHGLLASSIDVESLPVGLLMLSDKPPGDLPPGERWWPAVGCGPLGQWWILWWTALDERQGGRVGMAKTEVALWPLDMAATLPNLTATLMELSGHATIAPPPEELLLATAEALITGELTPICTDLDAWPGLLAALWKRMWPTAKRRFMARSAILQPSTDSALQPLLYCVPPTRANAWIAHTIIRPIQTDTPISRTAHWLIGKEDDLLQELLDVCPINTDSLKGLRRYDRIVEGLDKLRQTNDITDALDTLRPLIVLAPAATMLVKQKLEALAIVRQSVPRSTAGIICRLANFPGASFPDNSLPQAEAQGWIFSTLPEVPPANAILIFRLFAEKHTRDWWMSAVLDGLKAGTATLEHKWVELMLLWLLEIDHPERFAEFAPTHPAAENAVLAMCKKGGASANQLPLLRKNSRILVWARLQAWCLLEVLPPHEAVQEQLTMHEAAKPGLEFMVENLAGAILIETAIAINNDTFSQIVAQRTHHTPELMSKLDLQQGAWRKLWASHIAAGGVMWPPQTDKPTQISHCINAIFNERQPDFAITHSMAREFAPLVYVHPERANIWQKLPQEQAKMLVAEVTQILLAECNTGMHIPAPEQLLQRTAITALENTTMTPIGLATILNWNKQLTESQVRPWIAQLTASDQGGAELGQLISTRGWSNIANDLQSRLIGGREKYLGAILRPCINLFAWWQQPFVIFLLSGSKQSVDQTPIIQRAAELGAQKAPDRLEHFWILAGGKAKDLTNYGSNGHRWHHAVNDAHNGKLPKGVLSLVEALLKDFPHSKELLEFKNMLETMRKY